MDDAPAAIDLVIVDDDTETACLLQRLLSQQGYKIQVTESGQQAIAAILASRPGLVLLDLLLPDMDGYSLCQQLKQNPLTTEIPVIVLSS
ncbi:MAG: response regulator, partial [Nodosilinea sp.]